MTPKQEAFVREYLIDLNATQAAIRAGYSAKTAEKIGSENLRKPELSTAIAQAQAERCKRTEIDADWMLRRLHSEATADLADLYDENGHLRPIHDWPEVWRTGLVTGIETASERDGVDEDGKPQFATVRKVKLSDRARLLEMIGKHINVGAFKERVELSGEVSIAERIKRAESRAKG